MSIPYRREIDGLRAIAVVAVVLYHAINGGSAGFVGVDVFFVISGYLLTSLLLKEQASTGNIDLVAFYARRVRRIFPAAAVLVVVVLALAPFLLTPDAVRHTARSALAALLFWANLFFQSNSGGYFDGASTEMPLLHLWSLSVEEQFYFLWPALLIVLFRFRARTVPVLAALALASFALAEWLLRDDQAAAFYQMLPRFWELAVGGIIAALPPRGVPRWVQPVGILLLLLACVTPFDHFPGAGAIPAVGGAALILLAVHNGGTNRVLASRPMVGLGLVSYSWYLWHWPLLAFYRANTVDGGSATVPLALCAFALLLAVGSYRWIEQPFRRMRWQAPRTVLAGAALSGVIALGTCAIAFAPRQQADASGWAMANAAEHDTSQLECPYDTSAGGFPDAACLSHLHPVTAVWGDSFGYSWLPLGHALGEPAVTFSYAGCPPLLGFEVEDSPAKRAHCLAYNQQVLDAVRRMDTVVLTLSWQRYVPDDPERQAQATARLRQGLRSTLTALAPVRRIVIVGPTPYLRDKIGKCIRAGEECGPSRIVFELDAKPFRRLIEETARDYPAVVVADPTPEMCTLARCPGVRDGVPLYYDKTHVSRSAAESYARNWAGTLGKAGPTVGP